MKTILKLTLVATLLVAGSSAYAQKFGYIKMDDLISLMPENDSAMVKLQALQKELSEQLEAVQVEFNTKALDYQKNAATLSDAVKEMRQKELDGVQQRYQELSQLATQQFQKAQMDLFDPVLKKAQAAIDKVSKENSFTLVFNTANEPLAYYNAATVTDILPLLKKELNLKDKPTTPVTYDSRDPGSEITGFTKYKKAPRRGAFFMPVCRAAGYLTHSVHLRSSSDPDFTMVSMNCIPRIPSFTSGKSVHSGRGASPLRRARTVRAKFR